MAGVELWRERGDQWERVAEHATNADGWVGIPAVPEATSVRVAAAGLRPWFGPAVLQPDSEHLEVQLLAGDSLSGRVSTREGRPLGGVAVRLVAGRDGAWPTPDFLVDSLWSSFADRRHPNPAVSLHPTATTDADGGFEFRGIEPGWQCAVVLDSERWIGDPTSTVVAPGQRRVLVTAVAATEVSIELVTSELGDSARLDLGVATTHLVVRDGDGQSKSLSTESRGAATAVRFAVPDTWRNPLSFDVSVRGQGWSGSVSGRSGSAGATNKIVVTVAPDTAMEIVLDAVWADGAPCSAGIEVKGVDGDGQEVRVQATRADGGYLLLAASLPRRITWNAEDSLRDGAHAPSLTVGHLAKGSQIRSSMPPGADLVVMVTGNAQHLILEVPQGARSITVNGVSRFRSVEPGLYSAALNVSGVRLQRSVEVGVEGSFALDFTR